VNKATFEHYYSVYHQKLCRYAVLILKDETLAEEAVQQVFFRIWEQRATLQIEKIYPYLIRSTKNEAFQLLKLRKISLTLSNSEYEQHDWPISTESKSETFRMINEAIQHLPLKCKEIMLLKIEDGLTHKEISEYLNISVKTIENQVSIAFKKLREVIKK